MKLGVSIIICCYNSEKRLPKTLEHIAKQDVPEFIDWEVIIVDNNSNDNTVDTAKEYWSNNSNGIDLIIVSEKEPGLSNARKCGINNSNYEYLIFCDDDNWLSEEYVQYSYSLMKNNLNIGVAGGVGIPVCEIPEPDWFKKYQWNFATGQVYKESKDITNDRAFVWGAGMVIRKSAWNQITEKGFELFSSDRKGKELSSGGDTEICYLLVLDDWRVWYDTNLVFSHYITSDRLNWSYLRKLHRGFGKFWVIKQSYNQYLFNNERELNEWHIEVINVFRLLWKNKTIVLKSMVKDYEGYHKVIQIEDLLGRFLFLIQNRKSYLSIKKKLKIRYD